MYRRQQRPFASLLTLFILGSLAGVVFLLYDGINQSNRPVELAAFTPSPTIQPTDRLTPTMALTPSPVPTRIAGGITTSAELFIPAIGVTAPIVPVFLDETSWNVSQLGMNVGHLQGTGWLDKIGNVVLSGHVDLRDGRGGIFRDLGALSGGEQIIIVYQGEERSYTVTERYSVEPDDLTPLYPTEIDRLTLITCEAYDFFQDTYQKRTVVVAERTG